MGIHYFFMEDEEMKFKHYIKYWHATYRQPNQSVNTALGIKSNIRTHIDPSKLGNMEVDEIKVEDVQKFLTALLISGNKSRFIKFPPGGPRPLARSTVNKIRQIIIASLDQAVKEHIINYNVAKDTEPIKIIPSDGEFFSIEAQQKFLQYTSTHRFHVAYQLLFFTGCRRGEILGLSWNNVDLRRNYISIRQTLAIEDGKIVLYKNHAKTYTSKRLIPIPAHIKHQLIEIRNRQKREKAECSTWNNPDALIFTNRDGSPHNPNYFTRNFKNVIRRMGLPQTLHLHSTRHSWATNMVQLGIPLSDIQALGGWSRPDVLLRIYAHTIQNSQKKAINKLWKKINTLTDVEIEDAHNGHQVG